MKANKLFLSTLALSLISIQSMSPADLATKQHSSVRRMPADASASAIQSTEIKIINNIVVAKEPVAKKAVTEKQLKALQSRLTGLEKSLVSKEVLLEQNSQEIKILKNENKIEPLLKLINQQKSEIESLKTDIKNSVRDIENQKKNNEVIESSICKSELKGEKLEADVKKLLEDKEAVLKEVDGLKKDQALEKKPSENSELIALMSQLTTMFSAQMQSQMQMQIQMLTMFSQMKNSFMPEASPYAFNPSPFSNIQNFGSPQAGQYGGFGVGIQASPWTAYQNPYSIMPNLDRQQLPQSGNSSFGFGFDFNQTPATSEQQRLPAGQRLQSPFGSQVIAV